MTKWYENPEGKSDIGEYRDVLPDGPGRGRGANLNPGNRFEVVRLHVLGEHLDQLAAEQNDSAPQSPGIAMPGLSLSEHKIPTQVFHDTTRKIINAVQSPDMGFDWTVNPYRGCEHGCVYCYARPYHEYLGFSSGIDFETKIMAKPDAPAMLEKELAAKSWQGEEIVMSAITDGWQPIEEKLRITRGCLELMARCRQPVSLITRSRRILRDIDLIGELNGHNAIHVAVTITTLDHKLASIMEPRASSPADRLFAIKTLAAAGVPVTAMVAPIIPGITDRGVPALLEAIAAAGATNAAFTMLRLPYQNKALFLEWLQRHFPDRAAHVETLLRDVYEGKLYDSKVGTRMRGTGQLAEQIKRVFKVFRRRYGLDRPSPPLNRFAFRRPETGGQMSLF